MYALLARYDVPVPKEETDIVTDLRYSWKKLKKLSADLQEHLSQMQAPFKKNLVRNIKLFVVDVIQFRNDFEANGPMVPGVAPMEADERLRKFQRLFEERERKWIAYSEGQKLFGLPVTEYKELEQTKEELQLLEKLYGLYTLVINTVSEFKEVLWADVKDELDGMTAKISEFQNGCKKMPKALREWDAYIEMKKTIDDFLESLPMVQDLTHTGMRDRHWTALEQVCGQELPVHAETFKLSGLLDANLLEYREDLSTVSEILEQWVQVQAMWMYLEAVFTSGDIAKQLPQESKRFQGIDKNWVKIMSKANEQPVVVQYCYGNDVLQQLLPHLLEQLEMCQKALSGYLDQKRAAFPRFYFVSDPNLLEILSQGSNPEAIQPHLQSVFDSIECVLITNTTSTTTATTITTPITNMIIMTASLRSRVKAEGNIEDWLNALLREMQNSLRAIVRDAASDCEALDTADLTHKYQAQVALIAIQFKWTADCEDALFRAKSERAPMMATNKKNQVRDTEDFEWQKQARFYWRYDMDYAMISVADVDFKYCNEYLGVKERLVITPLTDRCYITLAQALGMFLGGAPAGPAGTGKTETTKDMGCTLGKYVVVTNCSDQMDYRIMGNILKGLAQSGCWGCFDEFNRIDLEVLSVVAQQVMSVLVAIREDRKTFQFTDGQVIALDKEVGFFITMNPGYAGRQELPENLKSLFRGVTMMVPDREIIMKVKLTACGYKDASLLAKKFNVLYALCEEQLSKQAHYDFGLRNILAVLRTAGSSKRNEVEKAEQELLMRTLRDMNLSKYVSEDVPLFMSLLDDLFPGLRAEKQKHKEVEGAIAQAVKDMGLQYHEEWVLKVVQVYEMCLVRHSIMHVGPSGVGKSRIVETLHKSLMLVKADQNLPPMVGQPHRELRMNPKAITAPQMFGCLDVIANEWTEGIFAQLWRKANKDRKNFTWLMLDGPVDAIWIENLNTVMDDNRILTLANNDRIPMLRPNVTLGFEVEDLRNASPATLDLGFMPYVRTWLASQSAKGFAELLEPLFSEKMDAIIEFCSTIALMTSMCNLIDGLLKDLAPSDNGASFDQTGVERVFMYTTCWSVAGILETDDRTKFDAFLRTMFHGMPEVEGTDTIYEYTIDAAKMSWVHWGERIPDWAYTGTELAVDFPKLVIPTIDSARTLYNLERTSAMNRAVLLVGGPGTAKTSSILQVLAKQDPTTTMFKKISMSGASTPLIFQKTIEGSIEKRQGKTFGPPGGKNMIVFVDDISMPQINNWGDQPTLEILRQLVEQGGLYNLQKPGEIMQIVDLLVVGCMLHPGGGKQDIPNRAKRHFHVMNVTLPSMTSIQMIFGRLVALMYPEDGGLDAELLAMSGKLVELTVNVWESTKAKMLPTPAKFHYIFNLRDLSRVFHGIFMCNASTVKDEHTLLALWKHEAMRVFSDRLVNADDKKWFEDTVNNALVETCGSSKASKLKGDVSFVDFLQPPGEDPESGEELPAPKLYEPAGSVDVVKGVITSYMKKFNESNKLHSMDLVLFEDAMLHFMRVSRLLAMPRGNALLVGVGGSGKQSLTRLAAFIARADFAQIVITKQYSASTLLEDFKPLYRTAGVLNKGVAFVFTDKEIKEETFLEYLNIFLNTGEVPNLFARDEYDAIIGEVGVPYSAIFKNSEPTKEDLWAFFIDRVRANLHLVLCFSPVGVKFRDRAMAFPGLINNCTIDWFLPWPEAALGEVAARMVLANKDLRCDEPTKHKLISQMAATHKQVADSTTEYFEQFRRNAYVTPKSYLSFMEAYADVYLKKVQHIEVLASSINTGLSKLVEAGEDVAKMKIELKEKEKGLVIAQEKSAVLLQEITTSTARAEKKKAEVQGVKDQLAGDADVIGSQKEAVERDLEAAQPALDAAQNALSSINSKDIGLLKQLKNPPEIIKRIFDCVVILFSNACNPAGLCKPKEMLQLDDSWSSALDMMGKPTFLNNIFNFDKDAINDETIELLYPYTSSPDFTYEDAKKASGNVAGLCTWVRAMDMYTTISKVVKPKMEELRIAMAKLNVANAKLAKAQGELDTVQDELNKMQRDFDEAMATKQRIQDDAESTQRRMDSANKLINGLEGERKRWTSMSEEFADDIRRLTGDVAISCAFVSYVGPFNSQFRQTLLQRFYNDCIQKEIPVTQDLKVTGFLVDQGTIGDWNLEGLPSDELSVQNGIMVTRSSKWPLLIDPQGQGLQWLKKREETNQLRVTSLLDRKFRNVLEDSMSFGTPMIIENVEEDIDPILDPVLNKSVQRKGRNLVIMLADKECEYDEKFKLSLTSKLANPHFTPELFAQVTVINFTVTMGGLEQQLLARVLSFERQELEEQRQKLVEDVNSNKKILKQLEDDLLFRLANSTGNLLDDTELIDVLNNTKTTSAEVSEKLANAEDTDKRINVAREEYRPVATRGALLYFLIVDMSAVNPMYQTSLVQFLSLFDFSITNSEKKANMLASKRIGLIIEYLTFHTTCYVQRGLFERHKMVWVLMLTMKIESVDEKLSHGYIQCLLKGGGALDIKSERPKPSAWIPDQVWLNLIATSQTVTMLRDLPDSVARNEQLWRHWYDEDAPEQAKIPEYDDRLTLFEKLLVVRSIREDRALLSVQTYVSDTIGQRYIDSRPLNLRETEEEANPFTPLVALLSRGADVTGIIMDLAKKKKVQVASISLGQGQEPASRKLIAAGMAAGSWVVLQNCHLGLKYMVEVEQQLIKLEEDQVNPNFRLWITVEPHPKFPIGLLQISIKITNEPPVGIRAGLKGSYAWLNQDVLDTVSQPQWKTMLYALCFMHTAVQERRKFGPLGFNVPYEFNQSDLSASVQFMQNHLNEVEGKKRPVDWIVVNYMVCEVQYGGKITDDWDRRLFNTYGQAWLTSRITNSEFEFYPGYRIPVGTDVEVFRKYIEELPFNDNPEIFGLHVNADLSYRTLQTAAVLTTILDSQPKEGGGSGGLTREETVLKIVEDLQAKLPGNFNMEEKKQCIKAIGGMNKPLNICLSQEIDRLQNVLTLVRRMLANLKLAIAGTIVMSPELQNTLDSLFLARVPAEWAKVSQLIMPNIGLWFVSILGRHEQLYSWMKNNRPNCFWLTGFFNPQGFLTANRQEVCRKHVKENWALDDVISTYEVLKQERDEVKRGPEEGIYLYGLYLDGCKWDKERMRLVDSDPKVLFAPLPVLLISACLQTARKIDPNHNYICPMYKNPTRTGLNFITPVDLRTEEPPNKWTLRGVCLLTSKD
ncbi:dynein heavy chain and region D6 of dynein motor-domain-containing protein [Pavlovales sp. CCMP2436]|nr:dynein heavy chain and region D6 of dynein motor-domain-containing protein [Pavlovales sp. CCMP2436]